MHKITALALGLLLLAVPGFAQYGGGGGTQTFTVPRLTVNPGPLEVIGAFDVTGDLTLDGGDLVFEGTNFSTTLTFVDPAADRTITLPDLSGTVALAPASGTFLTTTLGTNAVDAANSIWGVTNGLAFGGATGGDGFEITLSPADPGADFAITLPALAGTVLLSGATNVQAGSTVLASDTSLSLHSNLNVTIDGDADNNNTGAVTLTNDNDTQQVLLSTTGVSVLSDNTVTLNADDATSNASLTLDGPGGGGTLSVSDGTDTADIRMGPTSVTIDGDVDDDGDGTVTLSADNSAHTLSVGGGSVYGASDESVLLTTNDGAQYASAYSAGVVGNVNVSATDTLKSSALDLDATAPQAALNANDGAGVSKTLTVNLLGVELPTTLFAALGAPNNGTMIYCTDCDPASTPCTAAGAQTGAFAFRTAGAWGCPF